MRAVTETEQYTNKHTNPKQYSLGKINEKRHVAKEMEIASSESKKRHVHTDAFFIQTGQTSLTVLARL